MHDLCISHLNTTRTSDKKYKSFKAAYGSIEQRISIEIKSKNIETRIDKFKNKSIPTKSMRHIAQDI